MVKIQDTDQAKVSARNLSFYYGITQALFDISIDIPTQQVTAFIGPSGCGKSTFLRTLNRMNDTIDGTRLEGQVKIDGLDTSAEIFHRITDYFSSVKTYLVIRPVNSGSPGEIAEAIRGKLD